MNLDYGKCRDNLVDKYNVIGLVGEGISPIEVESGCPLSAYVVGDVLRTMCRAPSLDLYREEKTDKGVVLNLTEKGVAYLKNNVHDMIEEYKLFVAEEEHGEGFESKFLDDDLSDFCLKPKYQKGNISLENLARTADLVQGKDGVMVIGKELNKNKLLNQNTYGSTSTDLAEDSIYLNSSDEAIVGSRNLLGRSGLKPFDYDL